MYAIILADGHQIRVEEGQELQMDYREATAGDELRFDHVLACGSGEQLRVGRPEVPGAAVSAEVLGVRQGPKLVVQKFRRRKNSRRRTGHRQLYLEVRIKKIESA